MVLQQKSERHSMQQAEEHIRKLYILHVVIKPKQAGFFPQEEVWKKKKNIKKE